MKKIFYAFLTLIVLTALAACGEGEETTNVGESTPDTDQEIIDDNEDEVEGEEEMTEPEAEEENEEELENEAKEVSETEEESATEGEITETVTLYFADDQLLEMYKEDREIVAASEEELPKKALEAWIDGPEHDQLVSFFNSDVEVQSVEENNGVAEVSFSSSFLDINTGSTGEMYITEQIALIMEQFGYDQTKILIDGEEVETFFGHVTGTEPIDAGNPDDYEYIE